MSVGKHRISRDVLHVRLCVVRLVVIADKKKVHEQFPIPLINRLEKHYVSTTSLLNDNQRRLTNQLQQWSERFVTPQRSIRSV